MKAVAYDIEPFEKEFLARANQKKHDITLIANPLSDATINFAAGKDAVIVFTNDGISASVMEKLAGLGIKYIVTRCAEKNIIDREATVIDGIKISTISSDLLQEKSNHALQEIADQTIRNLDLWQQNMSTSKPASPRTISLL
ncbi:lactate dehydrogenase [Mucilaginibacter sp. BJC16-A38]|uniref:lactate dehydrogenase n=1 Tax=Mucilaginibacter phenanthrenivorans TaxID=1234842 RepID=UPI0021587F80|nr:lactate dehydrogenase [Mucilaginibacter phenanthrenivorans]MCR8560778.1 lactate dehydrogenase [Mucilaginibacter phenanthrenivorans]